MFLNGYVRLVDEIAERRARLSSNWYSVPPLRGYDRDSLDLR